MDTELCLFRTIVRSNWFFLFAGSVLGFLLAEPVFARGIAIGGIIVTVNFHLLARTLRKYLRPENHSGLLGAVLARYYVRFTISGAVIFLLIQQKLVDPIGLFIGLSVVVASIIVAAIVELKKLIFKEAV